MSEQSLSPEDILQVNEVDPGSRMRLLNQGDLMPPGCCAVCGNGNFQSGYLALDVFIDFFGDLYLCLQCLSDGASASGMLSLEQSNHVKEMLTELASDNNKLKEYLKEARERITIYERAFSTANIGLIDSNVSDAYSDTEPVDEGSKGIDSDPTETIEPQDDGKPEPDEPVKVVKSVGTSRTTRTNANGKSGNNSSLDI